MKSIHRSNATASIIDNTCFSSSPTILTQFQYWSQQSLGWYINVFHLFKYAENISCFNRKINFEFVAAELEMKWKCSQLAHSDNYSSISILKRGSFATIKKKLRPKKCLTVQQQFENIPIRRSTWPFHSKRVFIDTST